MEELVPFATLNANTGNYVKGSVSMKNLEAFPKSLFSMIVLNFGKFNGFNNEIGAFVVEMSVEDFENTIYFYEKKVWKNPFLAENKLGMSTLQKLSDYLDLPDNFEELCDQDEEYEEDDYDYYADISSDSEEEEWDPIRDDPSCYDYDSFDDDHNNYFL